MQWNKKFQKHDMLLRVKYTTQSSSELKIMLNAKIEVWEQKLATKGDRTITETH
jgi:hypothetical protein